MIFELTDPEGPFYRADVTSITPPVLYLKRYKTKMFAKRT